MAGKEALAVPTERTSNILSPKELQQRRRWQRLLTRVLNASEIRLLKNSGLQEARRRLKNEEVVFLYADHQDQTDPYVVMDTITQLAPEFQESLMLCPIASHQDKILGVPINKFSSKAGLILIPIFTKNSRKKAEGKIMRKSISDEEKQQEIAALPRAGSDTGKYSDTAKAHAKNGRLVVYLPTQPERAANLAITDERPLARIAMSFEMRKFDLSRIGVLFVGVLPANQERFNKEGGYNFGRGHSLTVGEYKTIEELKKLAGGLRGIDDWALVNMFPDLVNFSYLSEDLRKDVNTVRYGIGRPPRVYGPPEKKREKSYPEKN